MVRYADDMVFAFQKQRDAQRFYKVLPKRLNKYGLEMHEGKSQLIKSGKDQAEKAARRKEKLRSHSFLGFTCYWGKSRKGRIWRLKYSSRKDRFKMKLKGLRKYLKENINSKETDQVLMKVTKTIQGWVNYHAISDNQRRVKSFIYQSKHILFRWFNRKGGKHNMNWKRYTEILKEITFPERYKVVSMFPTLNKRDLS